MPPSDTQHILDTIAALDTKLSAKLSTLEGSVMALSKTVQDFKAVVDPALQALKDKVTALEAKIAAGTGTPEDVAYLQSVAQQIADLGK